MKNSQLLCEALGKRWYDLQPHPEQIRLITENKRFKVIPAGRRSGKTERLKRYTLKKAFLEKGLYFLAAPTRDQAKQIFWRDVKEMTPDWTRAKQPSETELALFLKNGSEVRLIGLDKPERFEGIPWTGGGIDEIANIKPGAWEANISPALDTPGLDTWCWLTGVPDGLNHYYDLAEYAKSGDTEWGFYTWHSADILEPDVIAAARRRMSPKMYRQEYEASFETASGRIYDDYSNDNHTDREFKPGVIHWAHDFNYMPMSSAIIQVENDCDYVVDEIIIEHAVARNAAIEFVERYRDHKNCPVIIYGDPSGRAGEKHGQESNYKNIEDILRNAGFNVKRRVFKRTKSIRDGQNSLRARILTADDKRHLFVNPSKAPTVDKGFKTVQLMKGSTYQEDENNNAQHVVSGIRYYSSYQYPIHEPASITVT